MRGLPGRGHSAAVLINAVRRKPWTGQWGGGGYCIDKTGLRQPGWPGRCSSCFKANRTAFPASMAALEIPARATDPCPQTLIQPAWALRWFTASCECRSAPLPTLAATLRWPTGSGLARGSRQLFSDPQWRPWTVRCHPDHPEGEGLTSRSSAGSADLVLPARPLEACPLPRISLLFSGFPCSQLGGPEPGLLGSPCWLKAADLASLDGSAFALALAGELRAGLVLMQGLPEWRRTAAW